MSLPPQLCSRRTFLAGSVATGLAVLTGCGSDSGGGTSGPSGSAGPVGETTTLRWAVPKAINNVDIAHGFNGDTIVQFAILDCVLGYDTEGKLVPQLAESWTRPTPTSVVFKLRKGVLFSDGSPLTADDVAFSLERHTDPEVASQAASTVTQVQSVKATANDEVTVTLATGVDTFLASVPLIWQVVPKKLAQAHPQDLGTPEVPTLGTGPYKIVKHSLTDGVQLERNEHYWGAKAPIARVQVVTISDPEATRLAMSAGDVDITSISPQEARKWEAMPEVAVHWNPANGICNVALNVKDEHLADLHVRRAIAHAIDREGVLRLATAAHGSLADTFIPLPQLKTLFGDPGYQQVVDALPKYPHDLQAAAQELAQSKYPNGFALTVSHAAGDPNITALQSIVSDLGKIGIKLTLKSLPDDAYYAAAMRHESLTLGLYPIGYGTSDVGEAVPDLVTSLGAKPQGFNFSQFATAQTDELVRKVLASAGEQKKAAVVELMQIVADQVPYVPMYYADYGYAISKRFTSPLGVWTLDRFYDVKPVGA